MAFNSVMSAAGRWPAALLLALWPVAVVAQLNSADYYVRDLPGLPKDTPPIKMHAGHIEVTPESNGNLFFWHFQNQHIANRQRTVIWINGGPGCSSEDGALMEIGPYRLKDENTLTLNNGSWHEFANLLFVDNPVGTGFSYVDTNSYVSELDEMANQFVQFLEQFFGMFPEYEKDDLYIAGESYAGQHIPYIAQAILDRNEKSAGKDWNLKGLLIGNGWISPKEQYKAYITFANDKGLIEKGSVEDEKLWQMLKVCNALIDKDELHRGNNDCESILSTILDMTRKGSGKDACVNMYDVRLRDSFPSCGMNWPPDLEYVTPYLRRGDVVESLHVNPQHAKGWQECSGAVSAAFSPKTSPPSVTLLPGLLEKVSILLFSGAEDLICNHMGTEELISNLQWNGGQGFETTPGTWAPRRDWTVEGSSAGFWQSARNLTYVQFYNASHMVPFDWPRRSRDMLDRFMRVDISSVGGEPADSLIDGEKGLDTTVGDATNNTSSAQDKTNKKVDEAKWEAYRRSGEIVLVIVVIAASIWGYFIWKQRRPRYVALGAEEPMAASTTALNGFRRKHGNAGDLEAAAFDENELDEFHVESPRSADGHYSVGEDSGDEDAPKEEQSKEKGSGSA